MNKDQRIADLEKRIADLETERKTPAKANSPSIKSGGPHEIFLLVLFWVLFGLLLASPLIGGMIAGVFSF